MKVNEIPKSQKQDQQAIDRQERLKRRENKKIVEELLQEQSDQRDDDIVGTFINDDPEEGISELIQEETTKSQILPDNPETEVTQDEVIQTPILPEIEHLNRIILDLRNQLARS